ncbi:MAG: hypothetical protein A2Y12_01830 [Planctomycetes bacterium GWF2_42_9]|nr:MAG: hypothetical protein A2Y12_01830 [Planctomycetes bacterium GWF2_42_9]
MEFNIEKELHEAVEKLEERLKIKNGFLVNLLNEDDWSFVIKSHALIEASVTNCLTHFLGYDKLASIFSRLELGSKYCGKLEFAKELELLSDNERRFISSLSQLRNQLVHNVTEVNFDFHNYINNMDFNQKKKFIDNFGYCYLTEKSGGQYEIINKDLILAEPKKTIWLSLRFVLATISFSININVSERKASLLKSQIYEYQEAIIQSLKSTKILP